MTPSVHEPNRSEPPATTTLDRWRRELARLDRCPWPGPRPLPISAPEALLVGRGTDITAVADMVADTQLVVLSGDSGVGKSSFLSVGVLPELLRRGYTPLICSSWSTKGQDADRLADPEQFVASKLTLYEGSPDPGAARGAQGAFDRNMLRGGGTVAPGRLCDRLDAHLGGQAVLILDQFEELIRYEPALFQAALRWVLRINRQHKTRVVLSLRAEYRHQLRRLDRECRPFTLDSYELDPIVRPALIRRIVRSGNGAEPASAISDEAADALVARWVDALPAIDDERPEAPTWSPVGLLELQSALYALHHHARAALVELDHVDALPLLGQDIGATSAAPMVRADLKRLAGEARQSVADAVKSAASDSTAGQRYLTAALDQAVAIKLQRCAEACGNVSGFDAYLVQGTRAVVQEAVTHLSSGGYKLVREEWDLAAKSLNRELQVLQRGEDAWPAETFRWLRTRCAEPPEDVDEAPSGSTDLLELDVVAIVGRQDPNSITESEQAASRDALQIGADAWVADPDSLSAGPLLGQSPMVVLLEEMRRCAFAIEWLDRSSLVRVSSAGTQTLVSLVHDGFSKALESWTENRSSRRQAALHQLTAGRGERYDWRELVAERASAGPAGGDRPATVANLRWRDCRISDEFRGTVFVNCDFSNSRFEGCTFEGAVFVNCLLDGATFDGCLIIGTPDDYDAGESSEAPAFYVDNVPLVADAMRRYQPTASSAGDGLYSGTSGVPAIVAAPPEGEADASPEGALVEELPVRRETGGLVMYGGRLSSLMVDSCTFDATSKGTLSMRRISGSSLDVVEQEGEARIELLNCAIRGFSITRPVDQVGAQAVDFGAVTVKAVGSALAETWFGDRLRGSAFFQNCALFQLWNSTRLPGEDHKVPSDKAPDGEAWVVTVDDCQWTGRIAVPDAWVSASSGPADVGSEQEVPSQVVESHLRRLDYRKDPARLELARRDLGLRTKGLRVRPDGDEPGAT
jgi:hypothetical protein